MIIPKSFSSVLLWIYPAWTESADVTAGISLASRITLWIFSFLCWEYFICYMITFLMTTLYMKRTSEKVFLVLEQWCSGTVFQWDLGENTNQNLNGLKAELDLWLKEARMFSSSIRGTESHSDLTQTQKISQGKKESPKWITLFWY